LTLVFNMTKEELRKKVELLVGKGKIEYVPSKALVDSIIDQLIEEGKIPPREKWGELKSSQAPREESE